MTSPASNPPADRNFFLTEPSPTGSRKWDALLAGLAVHLCRTVGLARTPSWTRDLARGIEGEIYVVGGAAMMLAYDRKRITRDIDAVGNPQEDIDAEVQAMALQRRDLGPDWLNSRVLPLLPRGIHADQLQVLGGPGLTVNVASPRWMLAMKARAARGRRDLDDQRVLANCKAASKSSLATQSPLPRQWVTRLQVHQIRSGERRSTRCNRSPSLVRRG